MAKKILIQGGRVINPKTNLDSTMDVLISGSEIESVAPKIQRTKDYTLIDASNYLISPGFIDIHCHLREPGEEYKETIITGTAAAAAGGFTTICAMPNTIPAMDNRSVIEFINNKSKEETSVDIYPIGAVTKGRKGEELTEMADMAKAGVIGFSDDGNPVFDPNIMRQALAYSSSLNLPIINHCEVPELSKGAHMNESWVSTLLGIKGMPNSAEDIMVARDISLSKLTGGHIHIAHVSTKGSIDLIRKAKDEGVNITCEVTPHHLTLTDKSVLGINNDTGNYSPITTNSYNTMAKVNPPLRSFEDKNAMIEGILDGTIDIIATDHAPHSQVEKMCTMNEAAFGISVLETALPSLISLTERTKIPIPLLIEKLTIAPAKFLNLDIGSIEPKKVADLTIFDPTEEWEIQPNNFLSKGKNTPLEGDILKGKIKTTIKKGVPIYTNGK